MFHFTWAGDVFLKSTMLTEIICEIIKKHTLLSCRGLGRCCLSSCVDMRNASCHLGGAAENLRVLVGK